MEHAMESPEHTPTESPSPETSPPSTTPPAPDPLDSAVSATGAVAEAEVAPSGDAAIGQSDVAIAPPLAPRAKTKGVADIVFLIDVSGSMAPVIDALRANIETFIDSLSKGDANNAPAVKD